MKFAVVCLLVALAVAEISAQSHSIHWGSKGQNDRLLFREVVAKKPANDQIVTKDVEYKGATRGITLVQCTDQYTNNNGGFATLIKGGPGYTFVTLRFISQRGHGFNFTIEVFGQHNYN